MNAMKRAHEIRREAAAKWNCKVSEILFSECLRMAWAETKGNKMKIIKKGISTKIETADGKIIFIKPIVEGESWKIRSSKKISMGEAKTAFEIVIGRKAKYINENGSYFTAK